MTYAGMARLGRAIFALVRSSARLDRWDRAALYWGSDRGPEFPTVADDYVDDTQTFETQAPEASESGRFALPYVLLGLAGLTAICAIWPIAVAFFLDLASGASRHDLWLVTIGVAGTVSLALAVLANRWIPERVALALMAFAPVAVFAIAGMAS